MASTMSVSLVTPLRVSMRPARAARSVRHIVRADAAGSSSIEIPHRFTQVFPKGDLLYVKVADIEEKTTGGILLPSEAQRRPTSGTVVAVGDGRIGDGNTFDFDVAEGDTLLYSKFGFTFTELSVQGEEYILVKENDAIAVMPRPDAVADDIPEMKPLGDRLLVKIDEGADETEGGVILTEGSKEKPATGTVLAVGPGKKDGKTGERVEMKMAVGDNVAYFKYAGDTMQTTDGTQYVVLHENDVLAKF